MVDYVSSIKRPFSDLFKLLMAIVISIVPIINFIFLGWLLDVIKSVTKKDMKLPEFNNFGQMFIHGFLTLVISFIYSIPLTLLMIVLWKIGTFYPQTIISGLTSNQMMGTGIGYIAMLIGMLQGMGFYLILVAVVGILFGLILSAAIINYAHVRKFSAAFDFSRIMKVAFSGHFFWNWLLTAFIFFGALGTFMALVPGIGPIIVAAIVSIVGFTNLAQAASEVKD